MDSITLNTLELAEYAHLGATTEFADLPAEDAQICRMIGLFFATNLHLAQECHRIEEITLTSAGEGKPPLAVLKIRKGKQVHELRSNKRGKVPIVRRRVRRRGEKR